MSQKIRLTKIFHFEMAHALQNYDGLCKNIHGHSYKLFVTILGEPMSDKLNPKHGMVMDFSCLKKIVNEQIVSVFDHCLLMNKDQRLKEVEQNFNVVYVDYQPTSENLLLDFATRLQKYLPNKAKLHSIKLYETENSYAEWFDEDQ
jgi:6-pyruvoyltetrahydropterin/6-carboxytetrahydropterin synthase